MFEIFPFIPERPILTFSLNSGSYFSNDDGTIISGSENNFKFPVPATLNSSWKDSVAFNSVLLEEREISKSPTAPAKSSGLFSSGNVLTLIICLSDDTLLEKSRKRM